MFKKVTLGAMLLGVVSLTVALKGYAALPSTDGEGRALPSLAPMVERIAAAVVNISTVQKLRVRENPLLTDPFFRRFFGVPDRPREREKQSLGSGVVVDAAKGYVLTNNHVIDQADEITVTLRDGRSLRAKVVGADSEADVAVIQIPADRLTAVALADSSKLRVGDFVVAIGNPFGLGQTVTSGIVSALGRSGLGIEGYEDFIQTDASINPGNSGGGLVNLSGELVGINTAILAPGGGNIGIGFAIPINMASSIMEQLVKYGEVRRGSLGISAQDLTPELAKAFGLEPNAQGAVISRIVAGSVAQKLGLQVGDIIVEFNGKKITTRDEVRNAIGLLRIGQHVSMTVMREGKHLNMEVTIQEGQPAVAQEGTKIHPFLAGALFQNIDESSPLFGQIDGVLVADVREGSAAWEAGLRSADVIVSVNRQAVVSVEELAMRTQRTARLLLHIRRGDGALFLLLQ